MMLGTESLREAPLRLLRRLWMSNDRVRSTRLGKGVGVDSRRA
jgi:hypothetical protein